MKTFWFCSSSILNSFPASSRGHRGKPLISFVQHNASDCNFCIKQFSSVQSLRCVQLFATPWTAAHQVSLSITNTQSLLKLISIELVSSNNFILCHPLLLLPSVFPNIRVFSNESALHIRCPKYCNCSFNISPSNEHPGLISFRMHWLDLLAVRGTHKSLLQHHSSKASVLLHSAFFTLTSIHDYWKNHSLD